MRNRFNTFPHGFVGCLNSLHIEHRTTFLESIYEWGGKLATIAVPVFFFLSGYLFEEGCSTLKVYKQKIRKRVGSVLVPFVVFNFFAICVHYAKTPDNISVVDFIHRLIVEPQDFPLWYLQNLMVLFLLTPLVMMSHKKWLDFSYLALTIIVFCTFEGDKVLFLKVRNWGFCFYNIGAFCNRYFHELTMRGVYSILLFVLGVVAYMLSILSNNYYLIQYYNLFIVLVLVFNLRTIGRIFKIFLKYSKYTSFIYFSHTILVAGFCVSIMNIYFCNVVGYVLTPILVVIFLIAIYNIMMRLVPKTFSFMIGNKIRI